MAQIKEEYVSFETAKLLKEKGFDEETRGYYPIKGDATGRIMFGTEYHHNTSQVQIAAPTLQMAMKWLREVHKLFVEIKISKNTFLWGYRVSISNGSTSCLHANNFNRYEEACEEAIKCCLENLI